MSRSYRAAMVLALLLLSSCGLGHSTSKSAEPAPTPKDLPPAPAFGPWPQSDGNVVEAYKAELKQNLDSSFSISTVGPWVIATNMEPAESQRIVKGTIAVCAAGVQRQLFNKTPRSTPAKVYLFRDGGTYEEWNKKLFHEKPISIYGYYSRTTNSLVMNIGTGGGTLIHEMVHAMAEADFPDIPTWLNEGLGSLYEASSVTPSGRIVGITNWRLKGLQEDLKNNTETQLDKLIGMEYAEFQGERRSSNYAAARYLMQWLQEQGKLEAFYVRVRDKKDGDPKKSLMAVFDNKLTIAEIHKQCFDWARTLKIGR